MNRIERVGRGLVATSFAILFAALSHVAAGAPSPSLFAIAVTVVVALPLSIALAGVRLSFARLATVVLASQALFHFSFALIGAPAARPSVGSEHLSHSMDTMSVGVGASPEPTSSFTMWFAHALAAAATIVVLAFGERAAVTLLTIVLAALAALRNHVQTLGADWPTVVMPISSDVHPIALRVAESHSLRGPPAFFA